MRHYFGFEYFRLCDVKEVAPYQNYLSASNTVSVDGFELPAVLWYLPVQRIKCSCRAAHAVLRKRLKCLVECAIHPFAGLWQYKSTLF